MKILEYQNSYGMPKWQEGFTKELEGRNLEEQLHCFAFTTYSSLTEVSYLTLEEEIRKQSFYVEGIEPVSEKWHVIVSHNRIVGVAYDKYAYEEESGQWIIKGQDTVLPYQGYIYDSTSDNNGSGYKKRDWYKYLICLPFHHTLW